MSSTLIPPLNQSYRRLATYEEWPEIEAVERRLTTWMLDEVRCPNPYDPTRLCKGRIYDWAIALENPVHGKRIAELGARVSFYGALVTHTAAVVHVSDLFDDSSFAGQGSLAWWTRQWRAAAGDAARLVCERADMRALPYEDASFDLVVSFSAIEHIHGDGDTQAAREMARVCAPGGRIVISTDMSDAYRVRGGHYYDEPALFARLIEPTGCALVGPHDFGWHGADLSRHKSGEFDMTSCIFTLEKPC